LPSGPLVGAIGIALQHGDFDLATLTLGGAKIQVKLGNVRPFDRRSRLSSRGYEALLMQGFDGGMGSSLMSSSLNFLGLYHGLHLHQLTDEPLSVHGAFLFITLRN
jgi:hypothetical protein